MKSTKYILKFIIVLQISAIITGCSGNKQLKVEDLKVGDNIGAYTINNIEYGRDFTFKNEFIADGNLFYNKPTGQIGINYRAFSDKIIYNNEIVDLSKESTIRFTENPELLKKYLDENTLNQKTLIKVKVKNFKLQISKDHVGMYAEIIEVLEINTKKVVEPTYPILKIKAKLESIALASDGAWSVFTSDADKVYSFYDDGNKELHKNIKDIKPNSTNHRYKNMWFDIEYQKQNKPFYNGGTGRTENRVVEVIIHIKESEN